LFVDISRELGVVTDLSTAAEGVPSELAGQKYEALLIDFDLVRDAGPVLAALRASHSNQNAVVFAVATQPHQREAALRHGANFVFPRPISNKDLRRTLYAAYDAMTRERRRYFRFTVELPVFLTRADGSDLVVRTSNVSANGMSISSSVAFHLGERVALTLDLQNGGPQVLARGTIVWDDKHGKSGISFQCVRPELQRTLDSWLDTQFSRMRELAVREFQNARAASQAGH
jgi:CheY-like chemotaxis protein